MVDQRWAPGKGPKVGRSPSLYLPCSFQYGPCRNGFGDVAYRDLLCLPTPIQIAGEDSGSGALCDFDQRDVGPGNLKHAAYGPEGCNSLQGAQGTRRAGLAAGTLG